MSTLTTSYFYGPLTVAQITETSVANNLQWYIDMHEVEFLKLLMGEPLYAAYVAGLAEDPIPAKWSTLRDKVFNHTGTAYLSPAANYVYFMYYRQQASHATGTGEAAINSENSKLMGNAQKCKTAWNAMAGMNKELKQFIEDNAADYPQYILPVCGITPAQRRLYKNRVNILRTTPTLF